MYIFGFTDLESGVTEIDEVYFHGFDYNLFCKGVSDCLKKNGVGIAPGNINENYKGDYKFLTNSIKNRIIVEKRVANKGYLYNSYEFKKIYSFFYNEVSESYTEEISISSIIEDYQNINLQEEPVDFITELKKKIQKREQENKKIEIPSNFTPKNVLQEELEREIFLRKRRKEKRDKKLTKKRDKRRRELE